MFSKQSLIPHSRAYTHENQFLLQPPAPEGTFKDGKLHFVLNLPGPNNTTRHVVYDGERPSAVPKSVTNVAAMMILPISVLVSPASTSTA
jgi:hypothetical protein